MAPPPTKRAKTSSTTTTAPTASQRPPAVQQSGDALDDDFALEPGFSPSDDDNSEYGDDADAFPEDSGAIPALDDDDDEDEQEEDEVAARTASAEGDSDDEPARKKRRAEVDQGTASKGDTSKDGKKSAKDKGKAKKEKRRAKIAELGVDQDEGERLAMLPNDYLVDRLAEKQRKALPKMSNIEMDDIRITGTIRSARQVCTLA